MKRLLYIAAGFFLLFSLPAGAQKAPTTLLKEGDSLRTCWRFEEAALRYGEILQMLPDSICTNPEDSLFRLSVQQRELLARNGLAMMDFVHKPNVQARKRLPRKSFYLHYPLPDRTWREKPNRLDASGATELAPATLVPKTGGRVYFSAPDSLGYYKIYRTNLNGNDPELVLDGVPESCNLIFPTLAPTGDELYFAADGLPGLGGYDLYCVKWNPRRQSWDAPVNLGFPYCSPADDLLYMTTEEGPYTVFASNRDCPADSVDVYVLEYEPLPVHHQIADPEELARICRLDPPQAKPQEEAPAENRSESQQYMQTMAQVRAIRDSISRLTRETDRLRRELDMQQADSALCAQILQAELDMAGLRIRLEEKTADVRRIETLFLEEGLVFDPDRIAAEAARAKAATPAYSFPRKSPWQAFTSRERRIIERSDSVMYVTVVQEDSVILRTPCKDFGPDELASPQLKTLIAKMRATVNAPEQGGVGIAAPQVGISRRLVLVQRFDKEGEPFEAYANIRIDSLSAETAVGPEGCLSVPPKRGMVRRSVEIVISYTDPDTLEERTETVSGYTAVIFQHECDHLDGILYIDRTELVADSPEWEAERQQYTYKKPEWWPY